MKAAPKRLSRMVWVCLVAAVALRCSPQAAVGQAVPTPVSPETPAGQMPGAKNAGSQPEAAAPPATSAADNALDKQKNNPAGRLRPFDPALPPPRIFHRPRIGLALGGGGALGLSEVGVLQWLDEHHVPVDVVAGTSMGCLVAALYSTGRTPAQLETVVDDKVFTSVFSFQDAFAALSFRRREDVRQLPNAVTIGLRHGVNFRNAVLTDQGLNALLAREFLAYDGRTNFNRLPIPLRCVATDLSTARAETFARGSIADAVRASVSLPAVYQPVAIDGHEFVDGGVLENLPTAAVQAMDADIVLAVSVPLSPLGKGDLGSLLGVLQRSFSVAIEGAEREQRKLAEVVIEPDLTGFSATDYLKSVELAKRGYAAAEANRRKLLPYAVADADWLAYKAHLASLRPAAPGRVLAVKVAAPAPRTRQAVERLLRPLLDEPLDAVKIEGLLDEVRSDGRYRADYRVQYGSGSIAKGTAVAGGAPGDAAPGQRPVIAVSVSDKATGPPFLLLGGAIQAQTGGISRADLQGILLDQDLGGYGSELRTQFQLGYVTELGAEYYHPLQSPLRARVVFVAPHADFMRHPYPIYIDNRQVDHREYQTWTLGSDVGWGRGRDAELRVGYDFAKIRWYTLIGADNQPDYDGTIQRVRARYRFDNQDRALVPQFGWSATAETGYLFSAVGSANAPQAKVRATYAHRFSFSRHPFPQRDPSGALGNQVVLASVEGGTMFGRRVAAPYQFTLGGPLRLTASAIDQYRGTDYFLLEPAILRRVAELPQPLGQSIYLGVGYEAGQMRSPTAATVTRQDIFFGVFAETPVGVVTLTQSIGNYGEHKFTFTLGKLF